MENFSVLFFTTFLCGIVSMLFQLAAHLGTKAYAPHLHKFYRYGLGTIGLLAPPVIAMLWFGAWEWVLVIASSAVFSGVVVIAAETAGAKYHSLLNRLDEHERLKAFIDAKTEEKD